MPNAGSMTYWYLQVPSIILLGLIALLFIRLLLTPLNDAGWTIVRLIRAITHPVVVAVGAITPRIVPSAGVIVCAMIWLAAARILLVMAGLAVGARI